MLCLPAELFFDCVQMLPLFVLHCLVCLLVSSWQLSGDVVEAFRVSLCWGFFCCSCKVVNVVSLICSYAFFHLFVSFIVLFLSCCLCCPGLIAFLSCLILIFCDVACVIHPLCCTVSLPTTSSQVLVHICLTRSNVASRSVLLSSCNSWRAWNLF